jgi:hypothetical protein
MGHKADFQEYVVPVYAFMGQTILKDGSVEGFTGYCNVLY